MIVLVVALGAIGAVGRAAVKMAVASDEWPWPTIAANTVASVALGALAEAEVAVTAGLLGALSTWSTLALETLEIGRRSRARAGAVVAVSLVFGVGGAWVGLRL